MQKDLSTLGWREWATLPGLGIERLKVKVDTGARTSALHAFYVDPFEQDGEDWVRFGIHPEQDDLDQAIECIARIKDRRVVADSGGHREERIVIETPIRIGAVEWNIEVTLTNRDTMKFRMLLGRTAMVNRFLVDPAKSYVMGRR